jgi:hypothetical protein
MTRSLVLCILSCVLAALALAGYLLWYHAVSAKSVEAETLGNQIITRDRAQSRIGAASAEVADLASAEAGVGAYFVAPQNVVPFIEQLQSLGASTGASVSVLSVAANPPAAGALPVIAISLAVTGSFDHVVRAVGAIEYAPYDLALSSLALAEGTAGAWTADVALTVGSASSTANALTPLLAPSSGDASTTPPATTP